LKDEQFNDQWKVSFANQAQEQDVSAVLDATCSPSSPIDAVLFQENKSISMLFLSPRLKLPTENQLTGGMNPRMMLPKLNLKPLMMLITPRIHLNLLPK
jgi:hypothetical protein